MTDQMTYADLSLGEVIAASAGEQFGEDLNLFCRAQYEGSLLDIGQGGQPSREAETAVAELTHGFIRRVAEALEAYGDALTGLGAFPTLQRRRPWNSDSAGIKVTDDGGDVLFQGDRPELHAEAQVLDALPV